MKISEARKGLRVTLSEPVANRYTGTYAEPWRVAGTLTSGRILHSKPPYEEGLFVRVKWDALTTPESWHLEDLAALPDGVAP